MRNYSVPNTTNLSPNHICVEKLCTRETRCENFPSTNSGVRPQDVSQKHVTLSAIGTNEPKHNLITSDAMDDYFLSEVAGFDMGLGLSGTSVGGTQRSRVGSWLC